MEEALESLRAKDTKERMAAVERLHKILEQSRRCLSSTELSTLVDALLVVLRDNNSRVCEGALQALASASALAGEHLKPHFTVLLPAIVERLGDGKQPVRFAARRLLLALMEISSPTIIVDRAGSYARAHKNWRVREEFARTLASAVNLFAEKELPFQRLLLPSVLQLLEDPNSNAREAAMTCLEEMYQLCGAPLQDELQHHLLRSSQLKEILGRFDKLKSKPLPFNRMAKLYEGELKLHSKIVTTGNRWNSPKRKTASLDAGSHGGESNNTSDKPVDPVQIYSEKDLIKEIEKVSSMLVPEQDWSVRITAMRRIEGLISGGAVKYGCFPSLVKQLVGPLSLQLADRRSIVIKQACNLLNLLSKELLSDFEQCAEAFVPVLSKLVVITVLVIAESADTCIKTLLRNCRVARVMPRIMDSAKNDRSSVLRARCCEYALLVLEQWSDSPEIQKLVDMYEDLIKCCVGDAMSEVRSTARACYRVFFKCWPGRAHRLFSGFDLAIQKLINEERGLQKRYPSPSVGDKTTQQQKQNSVIVSSGTQSASAGSHSVTFREAPVVPLDKTANILTYESKTSKRSLERALQESLEEANAVELFLNGMDRMKNDCVDSSSKDEINGGNYRRIRASASHSAVDRLSTSDPPFPMSTSITSGCNTVRTVTNDLKGMEVGNGVAVHDSDLAVMQSTCVDFGRGTFSSDSPTASIPSYSVKRAPVKLDKCNQGSSNDEGFDMKKSESCVDKVMIDHVSRDDHYKNNSQNSIPGFQRPLMKATASLRSSSMSGLEEAQAPFGDVHSYMDGLLSLNQTLTEGLSANADWSARVAAFNFLNQHLGQGSKGVQDIMQSFEKVMKLFSMHLNDPHHKVSQAALSTLTEVMPACRKLFESYLERILPHVFARLIDPKEFTRQLSTSALGLVADLFSIDSLFPALLRSLDEQRSPKAKMAVIDFTVAALSKLAVNGEVSAGRNLLNLWLAKLASLANDKNAKLKETAVNGIISVYTHFDSSTVLNFILSLTIEEQGNLRRALRQYTPRIETELMSFPQNRSQKPRSRHNHEQVDASSTLDDRLMLGRTLSSDTTNQLHVKKSSLSVGNEQIWKRSVIGPGESVHYENELAQSSMDDIGGNYFPSYVPPTLQKSTFPTEVNKSKNARGTSEVLRERISIVSCNNLESNGDDEIAELSQMNAQQYLKNIHRYTPPREMENTCNWRLGNEQSRIKAQSKSHVKHSLEEEVANLPVLLNQLCSGSDEKAVEMKRSALGKFLQLSKGNSVPIWSQFRNQILTGLLEAVDDADPSVRELALLTVLEMLGNQKDILGKESIKVFLEKLLHCTGDLIPKISTAADRCISIMLSQYDPHHCLSVIVPYLNSDEEKMLVTCIGSLTKLVVRIPSEDLMSQLPCFLPALFDAFGHRSADVRKAVVFCLVDIYIVLGQAFLPYLSSLSSTQLRLVTIYANRISQARSRAPLNS